jgi:hypothetical protein
MGPCKNCGQWHCTCDPHVRAMQFLHDEIVSNRRACEAQIEEHRSLKAKRDPAFQRFMQKVCAQ